MPITGITLAQTNTVNSSNLLAAHSPLAFIANVNYSGDAPTRCLVDIISKSSGEVVANYQAIFYQDTTTNQRQFVFLADEPIRALMDSFDDVIQGEDTLYFRPELTKELYIRFVDPDDANMYSQVLINFAHASRQFGEGPNMESQYDNDPDTYYAVEDGFVYVYFYNDDENNIISTNLQAFMNVQPQILDFGDVTVSTDSPVLNVALIATGLTGNVNVTPPAGFEVSEDGINFFSSLALVPVSGVVSATVYIRFSPVALTPYSGNVSFASTGLSTVNVAVSGVGIAGATPLISTSLNLIAFANTTENTVSASQSILITGSDLTADITVNAPAGFKVSTDNVLFLTQLTLIQAGGLVNQTIYARFEPTSQQAYSSNIVLSSTGAANKNVQVTGTGIAAVNPVINVVPTNMAFSDTIVNSNSSAQSITVTASDLSTSITVNAPAGFRVSTDGTNYLTSVTLPSTGGTVFVKFYPTAVQAYGGSVSFASTGAVTKYTSVGGNGIAASVPAFGITPSFLFFGPQIINTTSASMTFDISGQNLVNNVDLVAPTGFSISFDGVNFYSSLFIIPVLGTISRTVYVRFTPTSVAFYNSFIQITSSPVAPFNYNVVGQGVA